MAEPHQAFPYLAVHPVTTMRCFVGLCMGNPGYNRFLRKRKHRRMKHCKFQIQRVKNLHAKTCSASIILLLRKTHRSGSRVRAVESLRSRQADEQTGGGT